MTPESDLALLPWDSEFFGLRIARYTPSRLRTADVPVLDGWARANAINCLYFLADPGCTETLTAAHAAGFKFVDMRVTFDRPEARMARVSPPRPFVDVRLVEDRDRETIVSIARKTHTNTRFFKDSRFARDRAADMYAEWLRGDLRDSGNAVVVATEGSERAVGYVSCHVSEKTGHIGLIGVDESFRGRGLGSQLLHRATEWCVEEGARDMRVITQADNSAAANLYSAAGFIQTTAGAWFHRWYS